MQSDETYALLRVLTSPVAAVTSAHAGVYNGLILNSAVRASLVPTQPRLAVFILKRNLSHDMIFESGAFGFHLLHRENWDLIWELGFHSGRERDKLTNFAHRPGESGSPLLEDVYARMDCRVVNVMDTGASTCFLGEVLTVEAGTGTLLDSDYFRDNMPDEWRAIYEDNLAEAQKWSAERSDEIRPVLWRGLREG